MPTGIYTAVRQLIFAQIYPAPWIFNPATRNFIGLQQLERSMPDYHETCHGLSFDLHGNMYSRTESKPPLQHQFEAILIGKFDMGELDRPMYAPDKQYIILIGGNTTCYQVFIPEMIALHKKHAEKAYIIGFNPPGVGLSPGTTHGPQEYCAALESIINNLCNNGVPARNIMIIGHSLGAAIAASTVAKYHELGKPIRLFADRTMMSLSEIVATRLQRVIPTKLLRYTLGALLYLIMKGLIKLLKLELDVARDFTRINEINPGAARGMGVDDDEVIKDCDLGHAVSPTQLHLFKRFLLKPTEQFRKSHSKPRHELIDDQEGGSHAEHYLDACISEHQASIRALPQSREHPLLA